MRIYVKRNEKAKAVWLWTGRKQRSLYQ